MAVEPFVYGNPGFKFGYPSVGWNGHQHRLSCEEVAEWWWYGAQTVEDIMGSYNVPREGILIACWWQARWGSRTWRKRWVAWLESNERAMWSGLWQDVPLPPNVATPPSPESPAWTFVHNPNSY